MLILDKDALFHWSTFSHLPSATHISAPKCLKVVVNKNFFSVVNETAFRSGDMFHWNTTSIRNLYYSMDQRHLDTTLWHLIKRFHYDTHQNTHRNVMPSVGTLTIMATLFVPTKDTLAHQLLNLGKKCNARLFLVRLGTKPMSTNK